MSEPTKETHVYVGMFRPTLEKAVELANNGECGITLHSPGLMVVKPGPFGTVQSIDSKSIRPLWLEGHFDEPVYVPIKEAMKDTPPEISSEIGFISTPMSEEQVQEIRSHMIASYTRFLEKQGYTVIPPKETP